MLGARVIVTPLAHDASGNTRVQMLVETDPDRFCREVLEFGMFTPGGSLLLDGIRHVDIYRRGQRLVEPSSIVLVHLSVDEAEAQRRVEARDGGGADLARVRTHRVESGLADLLPQLADRLIDASAPVAVIADQVLATLPELGVPAEIVDRARARLR
jgi:hypothetical protein